MTQDTDQAVVLGGGLAGLVTARELLRRGWSVTVIEKEEQVGGLARTVIRGSFRFDIGGHRFHSHSPMLVQWLRELLGDELLYIPRRSRIWLGDRFVDYPLQFPGALKAFSPGQLFWILASYVLAVWQRHSSIQDISFEDWVVRRFGRALYEIYFRPYTEKVWGISCQELSADWAAQRISLPNLSETVKRAIYPGRSPPATIVSRFWYPRHGFGTIPDRLAEEIKHLDGRIITDAVVSYLRPETNGFQVGYQKDGQLVSHQAPHVVSSIPLTDLLQVIPPELGSREVFETCPLRYRDLICVFLTVNQPQVSRDSWTYFPQKELLFGRTHEPRNWSEEMAPHGQTSLVAEIFTGRDEPTWDQADDALLDRTVRELESVGFLPRDRVANAWVLRVENAYPLYQLDYAEKLQRVRQFLARWPGLHLVGRTGSFRYLNSDGVIEDALALVNWLTGEASSYRDVSEAYYVP